MHLIRENYGVEKSKHIKEYINMTKKHEKCKQGVHFIKQCQMTDFTRINVAISTKNHKQSDGCKGFVGRLRNAICKEELWNKTKLNKKTELALQKLQKRMETQAIPRN
jgi:hypothetical protein